MSRFRNVEWSINDIGDGKVSPSDAQLAVLMDIRRELQSINWKLNCYRIPVALDALRDMGIAVRRKKRKKRNVSAK